jgi:lipid II:glycine glycyltransferase (peptidoglycan interpeptide bridge formation enzyme)
VRAVARRQAAVVFRVSPGRESAGLTATLERAGFTALEEQSTTWNTPRPSQTLDLSPPEAQLLRAVRRRFREHIAAGARKGVVVEESESDADLLQFHALLVQTGRMKRIPVRDLSFYRSLFRHYRGRGLMLLVARAQGRLVGGILGVRFGGRVSMLYTSIRSGMADGLRHGVAPVMFWEFIRRAKQAGCDLIDLGSSGVQIPPSESDSGYGVYRFKVGLGAVMHDSPRYHDLVFRPLAYRALRVCESRMLPQMWRLAAHATTMSALRRAAA